LFSAFLLGLYKYFPFSKENNPNYFKFIGTELAKFPVEIVGFMGARIIKPISLML
jgi:hypothetical protein